MLSIFHTLYAKREQISRRKRGFILLRRGLGLQGVVRKARMKKRERWRKDAEGREDEEGRRGDPSLVVGNFSNPGSLFACH